jgi:hypothetical protein
MTASAIESFFNDRPDYPAAAHELIERAATVSALQEQSFTQSLAHTSEEPQSPLLISPSPEGRTSALPAPTPGFNPLLVPSSDPAVAENGDIRGADNDGDGRAEPVHVRGYYRKDGTYVRGHYRARPRR